MNQILVLGAGRSSSSLIDFLLQEAETNQWRVVVGDYDQQTAARKVGSSPHGFAIRFDINDEPASRQTITAADVVISMMPAHLHIQVARHCLELKKHLLNASYVSEEMKSLHDEAVKADLLFLNECGLDPGIDHMSAMQVIDRIKEDGGKLVSFESFTGGLIAPETDPGNPWRYKFTWNPRNVVMAGQGTAKFLQQGHYKFIPYQQLFQRITPVAVEGYGAFEGYANRDSLKYLETYGLDGIETMLRGTLRNKGFCSAWNVLVQLGCCDDTYMMDGVRDLTHRGFVNAFLDFHPHHTLEEKLATAFNIVPEGEEMTRLRWSGFFSEEPVGLNEGTPAQILEHILSKKWKLQSGDKDFIVMWHRFVYELDGKRKTRLAHLTATGKNETDTAMAKTVGLPLGLAARLLLQGKLSGRGVVIPVTREIYDPVLRDLEKYDIRLTERDV